MILLLSEAVNDVHVTHVAAELGRRDAEHCIYDPGRFPLNSKLTLDSEGDTVLGDIDFGDDESFDLSSVSSVWYRRPSAFSLPSGLEPPDHEWLSRECNLYLRAVWATLDALWVSEPENIRKASLKPYQLKLAQALGFKVPRYVITNNVDRASAFIRSCPKGVITKALGAPYIFYGKQARLLYTHLLRPEDLGHLDAVRYGPAYFQEYIKKTLDVRVTVIGDKAFAVGIRSSSVPEAEVDFRKSEIFDLQHERLELPPRLNRLCVKLVAALGLRFGAIDLLLGPDGEYYFLEINPNGQWLWLEWTTGVPLVATMCDLLMSGSAGR